jgi:hypothetical protein
MEKTQWYSRRRRCPRCGDDRLTYYSDGTGRCIDGHEFEHEEEVPRGAVPVGPSDIQRVGRLGYS